MSVIPHSYPDLDPLDVMALKDCIDRGFVGFDRKLEEEINKYIRKYIHQKEIVLSPSGSMAMLVALRGLGVSPGDPVVIPAFPAWSIFNALRFLGARPVICDVRSPQDFRASFETIAAQITREVKVVIVTHMFGVLIEEETVRRLKEEFKVKVIEDYASAFGALHNNISPVGKYADYVVASFGSTKPITAGAGGFVAADHAFLTDAHEKPVDGIMAVNCEISCLNQRLLERQLMRMDRIMTQKNQLKNLFSRFVNIWGNESNALYRAITFDSIDPLKQFFVDNGLEVDLRNIAQANFAKEYGLDLPNARGFRPYTSIPLNTKFAQALEAKGLL